MNHEQHINCLQQAFNETMGAISKDEWSKNGQLIRKAKAVRNLFLKVPKIKKKLAVPQNQMTPWNLEDEGPAIA